jgi:hypothetical protein
MVGVCEEYDSKEDRPGDRLKVESLEGWKVSERRE